MPGPNWVKPPVLEMPLRELRTSERLKARAALSVTSVRIGALGTVIADLQRTSVDGGAAPVGIVSQCDGPGADNDDGAEPGNRAREYRVSV